MSKWMLFPSLPLPPPHRPVHDHGVDSFRRPDRLREARRLVDRAPVEDREIGESAFAAHAATFEAEALRGEAGHLVDRRLERKQVETARIVPEHAREAAPQARMGRGLN